jgi:hypothetical protein
MSAEQRKVRCCIVIGYKPIITFYKIKDLPKLIDESKQIILIKQRNSNLLKYDKLTLNSDDCDKYIKLIDNASFSFNFNLLITALRYGYKYFNDFQISINIEKRINCWVKSLGKYSYVWTELLDKPNYGLEVFKTRFWPFYNVDSKDWKFISISILNEYPGQQDCITSDEKKSDFDDIEGISQKYNNFLGHTVLHPEEYPKMNRIINKLKLLKNLNLSLLMYEAILKLLITPSTCHIIKYTGLWKLIDPLFKNEQFGSLYKDLFYHFMYYAMFILLHEDTVMFSQIRRNHRIIFTHEEALNMPQTYKLHLEQDPYIQQLTGETYLMKSIPYYLRGNRYIFSKDIFERRFYLATGGALVNIPLHKFNAAVSGSILIPCLVYCPLEKDFKNIRYNTKRNIVNQRPFIDNLYNFCDKLNLKEKDFISYLEYLYPSYHSLTDHEYIDQVLTQSSDEVKMNTTEEKKEPEIKLKYNLLSDIDISITTDNYESFNELALLLGKQIQKNCAHIGNVWIKKIYTAAAFKYKLYGPGLMRPIDLFRVPYGAEKMIKKFHCPIVRSLYDGCNISENSSHNSHVHLDSINKYWSGKKDTYDISYDDDYVEVPEFNEEFKTDESKESNDIDESNKSNDIDESKEESSVVVNYKGINMIVSGLSAALSGVNNNYRWFFNNKPCCEVILKYAQRGFSTIINDKERLSMIEYMKITPKWKKYVENCDGCSIDVFGIMTTNHIFFNPCINNDGIRYKLRPFKKNYAKLYNKKSYVGLPQSKTEYDVNLIIKDNNKVYHPDVNKINLLMNHINNLQDDFSDCDDF